MFVQPDAQNDRFNVWSHYSYSDKHCERTAELFIKPSDSTTIGGTSMTVLVVLGLKHPDPCTPPDWVLPSMDDLPYFEDSEITVAGSHILSIAHQLQEGAAWSWCA